MKNNPAVEESSLHVQNCVSYFMGSIPADQDAVTWP